MSDHQMVAQCKMLIEELKEHMPEYDDVFLTVDAGMPVVAMPEGRYIGMSAIRVLENLCEDIDWEDFSIEDEEDDEE
jgi:hypothetical protein